MEKRTSAPARIFAVLALIGAVLIVIVVLSSAGSDDNGGGGERSSSQTAEQQQQEQDQDRPQTKAKTYVVKSGDTLTAIAHRTGVPVQEILALNPEVDPQILIAGETLKLR